MSTAAGPRWLQQAAGWEPDEDPSHQRHARTPRLPPGATVLFDGGSLDHWKDAKLSPEGLLEIGCTTKEPVGDFRLHLEFRTPYMPFAAGRAGETAACISSGATRCRSSTRSA